MSTQKLTAEEIFKSNNEFFNHHEFFTLDGTKQLTAISKGAYSLEDVETKVHSKRVGKNAMQDVLQAIPQKEL